MRRCCQRQPGWVPTKPLTSTARRWRSHDRASLTEEALLNKIEAGLGDAPDKPRVDPTTKRVKTAAGELPISPLFDPEWIAKRRRTTKTANPKPSGRFRSKVYNNIYARALETPLRACPASRTLLPRFFLQDFEAVAHPKTGKPWWAPGPLSFYHLENDVDAMVKRKAQELESGSEDQAQAADRGDESTISRNDSNAPPSEQEPATTSQGDRGNKDVESGLETRASADTDGSEQRTRHRGMGARAPVVAYALSKKSLLSHFKPGKVPLLSMRGGMSVDNSIAGAVWRPDMVDFLEGMLRKQVVDALIRRANRLDGQDHHKFIEPCASWDKVQDVRLRGCVLWLPRGEAEAGGYRTLDVESQFGSKLAVYNLPWLLGEEGVARLRAEAPMFLDTEILVLKSWPSWSVKSIHMLLWRLQGFLSEPQSKTT